MKYGLWTVITVQDSYFLGSAVTIDLLALQILHFIMFIQGFILVLSIRSREVVIVVGWMILNDFMDYYVGTHPWLRSDQIHTAMWLAVSFTILVGGWLIYQRFASIFTKTIETSR